MKKNNEGFSLVEVLLAMVLLAAIVIPTCTSLVLSFRMNAKAEALMQAQLAVSSAVETLMATKINDAKAAVVLDGHATYDYVIIEDEKAIVGETDQFPDVKISMKRDGVGYKVEVTDNNELVTVTTYIQGGSR